jgi:hypothetical protein
MTPLLHWLNVHLWGPMWPNIFAPSAMTLAAVAISHARAYRQRERHHAETRATLTAHHEELKQHVTAATAPRPRKRPGDAP